MLCIKKNKCFSTVLLLSQKKQTAYCNPFRPVETRLNLSKHVSIRSDLLKHVWTCRNTFQSVQICPDPLKHVQTCWNLSKHVSRLPPLPLLPPPPPFPLSLGGGGRGREGEGGGETPSPKPPGRGGDEVPPPLRILTKNYQNSLTLSSLCVIYPRGFSQSTAQNY